MDSFQPVLYSIEENQFFLKHLGESPLAALQEKTPEGVNPVTVREVLGEVYDLDELEKHRGIQWAGREAVSNIITRYLSEHEKWKEMSERGAPRFPTMHAWDGRGRPHRGGVSSDSKQVTTYFDDNGDRQPLSVMLRDAAPVSFKAPWVKKEEVIPDRLIEDTDKGIIQCPIDGWTTNFKPESRQSYNIARARMSKHCRSSKDERVQEFAIKIFG
jgi:hypothetical protein|tara:strand:+ start:263 stop:907 length:645 start_codon:yes stop_codon:yes gene_type:complete